MNAVSITLERSQALAKDIVVAVRSWNSKQRKGFTVYNPGPPGANSTAQEFSVVRPNLTGDQAQDFANRIRTDLSDQERLGYVPTDPRSERSPPRPAAAARH